MIASTDKTAANDFSEQLMKPFWDSFQDQTAGRSKLPIKSLYLSHTFHIKKNYEKALKQR